MSVALTIHQIVGAELEPWLDALGGLRIRVLRRGKTRQTVRTATAD